MVLKHKRRVAAAVGIVAAIGFACNKKDSDKTEDSSTSGTDTTNGGKLTATKLSDLNLPGILAIDIPDSVTGKGKASALRLTEKTKSSEACQVRQQIKEGLDNIAMAKTQICMIQNAPGLEFGKKYNISLKDMMGGAAPAGDPGATPSGDPGALPGGDPGTMTPPTSPLRLTTDGMPDTLQVWIDNSTLGKLKIYFCEDKKLTQYFDLDGTGTGKAKGKLIMKQSIPKSDMNPLAFEFHRVMNFDSNYTVPELVTLNLKEKVVITSEEFGKEGGLRYLSLALPKSGVSKVSSSFKGLKEEVEDAFTSFGAFSNEFGMVVAKGKFGAGEEFSNESFFDGAGYKVDKSTVDSDGSKFGEGGTLGVKAADVPKFLAADFSPEGFPADAWDCSGTTDLSLTSETAGANPTTCQDDWAEFTDEECTGAGFAQGEVVSIDETQQKAPEDLGGFDPATGTMETEPDAAPASLK